MTQFNVNIERGEQRKQELDQIWVQFQEISSDLDKYDLLRMWSSIFGAMESAIQNIAEVEEDTLTPWRSESMVESFQKVVNRAVESVNKSKQNV